MKKVAEDEFMNTLLPLYWASQISAETTCLLCHWASQAGMGGLAATCAKPPGKGSSKYKEHLDRALGANVTKAGQYSLQTPAYFKHNMSRSSYSLHVLPPHESLHKEMESDQTLSVRLQDALDDGSLPPAYLRNPIVNTAGRPALPLALYLDGVSYSQVDTVCGVWIINLLSGTRTICALVRKKLHCRCGCKGWCTYYPLLRFLEWSVRALAEGVFPGVRHDGQPFDDSLGDADRSRLAGQRMKLRGAVIYVKGDWSEFCGRLGLPTWQDGLRPCPCCTAVGGDLFNVVGVSLVSWPCHLNDDADYEAACTRCEIRLTLTAETHALLAPLLTVDLRGKQGPLLKADVVVGGQRLEAGDRLEPSGELLDTAAFAQWTRFPLRVVFWRSRNETMCRRRCPLLARDLGLTLRSAVAFDVLHTLHLGVMNSYCCLVLWQLVDGGIWGESNASDLEPIVLALRSELWLWYAERARAHPGENLTRMPDLLPKHLGSRASKSLKAKGAQTYALLLFCVDLQTKFRAGLGANTAATLEAGQRLVRLMELMKTSGPSLGATAANTMLGCMKRHMVLLKEVGGRCIPKHHLMLHLLQRALWFGNPLAYDCFRDEAGNKLLKASLRNVHQLRFEAEGLLKANMYISHHDEKRPRTW